MYAYKLTKHTSLSTSTSGEWPTHVSGDTLVAVFGMKSSANDFGTPTGMTSIGSGGTGNYTLHAFYVRATSSATTDPVSTGHSSVAQRFCATFVIPDAPVSSPIDTSAFGTQYTNTPPYETVPFKSGTTTVDNVLCLQIGFIDGWNHLQLDPGPTQFFSEYIVDGQSGCAAAWTFQEMAGAVDTFSWSLTRSINDSFSMLVPIKISGNAPGRGDPAQPPSTVMHAANDDFNGRYGATAENVSTTVTSIDSITTNNAALGDTLGDGLNPFHYLRRGTSSTVGQIALAGWTFDDVGPFSLSTKKVAFHPVVLSGLYASRTAPLAEHGLLVGLKSGTNEYALFDAGGSDTRPQEIKSIVIDANSTIMHEENVFDPDDVVGVVIGQHSNSTDNRSALDQVQLLDTVVLVGTCTWATAKEVTDSATLLTIERLGDAYRTKHDIQIGNGGTNPVTFTTGGEVLLTPNAASVDNLDVEFQADKVTLTLYGVSGDSISINDPISSPGTLEFIIHASSTSAATWDFSGGILTGATKGVTLRDLGAGAYAGFTISGCPEITHNGADLTGGVTLSGCTDDQYITLDFATVADLNTAFAKLAGVTFQNSTVGIRLNYTGAANLTGSTSSLPSGLISDNNTYDMRLADGGFNVALTIPVPTGSGWSSHDTTGGGTSSITFSAPTFDLDLSSNVSCTFRVFTTGTQTQLTTGTGTSLSWTHGNQTVDITCWAAGYQQQRLTGIDLTNANVSQTFELVDVPSYNAGHGLSYTTDLTYDRTDGKLDPLTRQKGPDLNSALIDAFDAQTALHNTDYRIRMDGANTAIFLDDAYINPANLDNWYDCGYEYRNTLGVVQKQAASFKSQGGTWTGATAEYQTTAGTGQTDARATGAIDEVIEIYDIAGDDLRSHWVWKYQVNGYREARADIVDLFGGNLQPVEYEFNMAETAIAAATGDPAVTLTFTDHGATPVTWNGKEFSITIQSNETGETILRELDYNHSLDATYNGESPFNWWDMVVESGGGYETRGGIHEGGTYKSGTTRKGVRVLNGSGDPHPDFLKFESDVPGDFYEPPVVNLASITNLPTDGANRRLQIRNMDVGVGGTQTYNDVNATSAYSETYTEGTTYSDGDLIRIRWAEANGATSFKLFEAFTNATASGWSLDAATQIQEWVVYANNGIDGSLVTGHSADHADDEVDLTVPTNFDGRNTQAFWCYTLTTALGIEDFWGAVTISDGEFYVDNDIVNIFLDNLTTTNVRETTNMKFHRKDGAYPVKGDNNTTGGGAVIVRHLDPVYTIQDTGNVAQATLNNVESTVNSLATNVNAAKTAADGAKTSADLAVTNLAVTDGKVDSILEDTGITLPGRINTVEGKVDATLIAANDAATTAETIDGKVDQLPTTSDEVNANVKKINDGVVIGDGSEADPWREENVLP